MTSVPEKLIELGIRPLVGDAFTPFSEAEVAAVENSIGVPLPEGYRRFLSRFGGSTFSENVSSAAPGERLHFGQFFRFSDLLNAVVYLRETLPETIIPFGDNWGDIVFCIGVNGDEAGRVYFHNTHTGWHYDAEGYLERGEPVPSEIRHRSVQQIAPSFEGFIRSMERELKR